MVKNKFGFESHLQTTPNPAGSPHSISQIPNADIHRELMEKRREMQARIRKGYT